MVCQEKKQIFLRFSEKDLYLCGMNEADLELRMKEHGVRPTAMRLLVLRALTEATGTLTLRDLEDVLAPADKSTLFRTLTLFQEHHLVHTIEDGTGSTRYEACLSHTSHQEKDDQHVHFHCTRCGSTFCLTETPIPPVTLPEGYEAETANFVMTGLCPRCARRVTRG